MRIFITLIVFVIVSFFGVALLIPNHFSTERSVMISGKSDVVFNRVNNLKKWTEWNPDLPIMNYTENAKGVGARQEWNSSDGEKGFLEIMDSKPEKHVLAKMSFPGHHEMLSRWDFATQGDSIRVSWQLQMDDFGYPMGRYESWLMEKRMETNVFQGLQQLKKSVENEDVSK